MQRRRQQEQLRQLQQEALRQQQGLQPQHPLPLHALVLQLVLKQLPPLPLDERALLVLLLLLQQAQLPLPLKVEQQAAPRSLQRLLALTLPLLQAQQVAAVAALQPQRQRDDLTSPTKQQTSKQTAESRGSSSSSSSRSDSALLCLSRSSILTCSWQREAVAAGVKRSTSSLY